MKKEDIHLYDLQRILQGNVPAEFYIELIIRGLFVYLMIAFGMKYMGKRITAEITRSELAAIASLAAATGLVLMAPDRGLLPPLIVLSVMVMVKSAVDKRSYKSKKFERLMSGYFSILVADGILNPHEMKMTRMSKEQLFARLRESGIVQLGMVKRLYLEANGAIGIVEEKEERPGLPVVPAWDKDFLNSLQHITDTRICSHCGKERAPEQDRCTNCRAEEWEHPVRS